MFTNLAIERGHQPCSENDDHSDNRILGILWKKTWGGVTITINKNGWFTGTSYSNIKVEELSLKHHSILHN